MTIHDLKLVCCAYSMYTNGQVCESCGKGKYYHCIFGKCVKNSLVKSLLGTLEMYLHHLVLDIYGLVDVFISPSHFLRTKLLEHGFAGKIVHLPNFVSADRFVPEYQWKQASIVYVGRLVKNKGVMTLLDAVKSLDHIQLKIIGEGPLKPFLMQRIKTEGITNTRLLGFLSGSSLHNEIRQSMFAVMPSELYENHPMAVIEAFALGKPVVGSHIGGIPELVINHRTGFTFEPGNAEDLRSKIHHLVSHPELIVEMGMNARRFVEDELNAETYYHRLDGIYQKLLRSPSK